MRKAAIAVAVLAVSSGALIVMNYDGQTQRIEMTSSKQMTKTAQTQTKPNPFGSGAYEKSLWEWQQQEVAEYERDRNQPKAKAERESLAAEILRERDRLQNRLDNNTRKQN